MAGCILFLPGILGSRLMLDGEEIWPPTIMEITGGYGRIDQLTDPAVKAGPPIGKVCLVAVYQPVLDDLRAIAAGEAGAPERAFHAFGYDWRIDLRDVAVDIARRIDGLPEADRQEIHFVGHSMGNLIIRLLLESGEFDGRPWFGAIRTLVSLAGPHRGAPAALARALGLEGSTGLSGKDIREMAADPRYPSLYQLLPHPGVVTAWNVRGGRIRPLDIFAPATARSLGLGAANMQKAAEIAAILARNNRPPHVAYTCLAGSGQDTWIRIEKNAAGSRCVAGRQAGDGTVPLWSAVDPALAHHVAPGVHDAMFRNDQIRDVMYRALGGRLPGVSFVGVTGKALVRLHGGEPVYASGEAPGVMLVPARPFTRLEGEIVITFSDDPRVTAFTPLMRMPLAFTGPESDHLAVHLPTMTRAGFYRVHFEGTHETTQDGAATFAISACGGAMGHAP